MLSLVDVAARMTAFRTVRADRASFLLTTRVRTADRLFPARERCVSALKLWPLAQLAVPASCSFETGVPDSSSLMWVLNPQLEVLAKSPSHRNISSSISMSSKDSVVQLQSVCPALSLYPLGADKLGKLLATQPSLSTARRFTRSTVRAALKMTLANTHSPRPFRVWNIEFCLVSRAPSASRVEYVFASTSTSSVERYTSRSAKVRQHSIPPLHLKVWHGHALAARNAAALVLSPFTPLLTRLA
mmetsp:Transcript_645/g.1689  ORF Transcript_645/g.1689 Transcript_645/m.1689 type:complete len:244 (-) Transcript_645:52-783(-)